MGKGGKDGNESTKDLTVFLLELADIRYRKGLVTYFDVLDAQQTLLAAELEMVQTDRARLTDMVTLFKAVSGGWGIPTGSDPS